MNNEITPYYFIAEFYDTLFVIDYIINNNYKIEQSTFYEIIKEIETPSGILRFLPNGDCCYNLKLAKIKNKNIVPATQK